MKSLNNYINEANQPDGHKKGDTVEVKAKAWFDKESKGKDYVVCGQNAYFVKDMTEYCGKEAEVFKAMYVFDQWFYQLKVDGNVVGKWWFPQSSLVY